MSILHSSITCKPGNRSKPAKASPLLTKSDDRNGYCSRVAVRRELGHLPAATSFRLPAAQLLVLDIAHCRSQGSAVRNIDRKSTRLNSSHVAISYAVFCLKKKKKRYILD